MIGLSCGSLLTFTWSCKKVGKSSFECGATMSTPIPMFVLYALFKLITVSCYTYQTQPLFLSVSDLEDVVLTAGGEHKVKTFVVKCHEDSIEVVIRASLFDPALLVEPTHLRLGPVSAARDHCRASESANGEYVMRAALGDCGSLLMVGEPTQDDGWPESEFMLLHAATYCVFQFTHSAVRYDYLLLYSPPPSSPEDPFQMEGAAVGVQCKYKRYKATLRRLLRCCCLNVSTSGCCIVPREMMVMVMLSLCPAGDTQWAVVHWNQPGVLQSLSSHLSSTLTSSSDWWQVSWFPSVKKSSGAIWQLPYYRFTVLKMSLRKNVTFRKIYQHTQIVK